MSGRVTVRLFAGLREAAGTDALEVDAQTDGDVSALRAALAASRPELAERLASCRFAIDDDFVEDDARVAPGAVVDVIPPVSGG